MWVVFHTETLEVEKTCTDKAHAKQWMKKLNARLWYSAPYEIEEFQTGKLDQWITWKLLTKDRKE